MVKRLILYIVLCLACIPLHASDTLDFVTVERTSYQLYINNQWEDLTSYGENAITAGFDYYYLRIRVGIAYYSLEEYLHAALHFQKALAFNDHDRTALEYLYYCYLYTNKPDKALAILQESPPSLKEQINSTGGPKFNFINFAAGYILSDEAGKIKLIDLDGPSDIYGEVDLTNNGYWLSPGIQYQFNKHVSGYLAYIYLTLERTKKVQIGDVLAVDDTYRLDQHQFYLNSKVSLGKGYYVIPAFHYIYVNYRTIFPEYNSELNQYNYPVKDVVYNNYIALLSLQKEFQLMTINLFGAWSNLNDDEQYQAGFSLTIYPLGNLNFYGTSTFLNHHEHGRNNFIFDQVVGFRIASPLWAEIYGTFGPQNNYYEKNALIVYNIPDQINFKGGGRLMLTLARNWLLSLDYQYLEKEGKLLTYEQTISENGLTLKPEYFQFKYHNHLISAGVQWKF